MKNHPKRKKESCKRILKELRSLTNLNIEFNIAGWSSLVARQAHNLKVGGSNPSPATKNQIINLDFLLSIRKALTVSLVKVLNGFPNFSIFEMIFGGIVII